MPVPIGPHDDEYDIDAAEYRDFSQTINQLGTAFVSLVVGVFLAATCMFVDWLIF